MYIINRNWILCVLTLYTLITACSVKISTEKVVSPLGSSSPTAQFSPLPRFNDPYLLAKKEGVEVYNIKDFGAVGDGTTNDTHALRAAYIEASENNGGVIYIPTGTYRVAPTEDGNYVININHSNIHFFGDGPTNSILSAYAWGNRDPEQLIPRRGGMFTTLGLHYTQSISNISIRNLRATGNASINDNAGQWWTEEQQMVGWDMTHKGLGIWGRVTDVLVDNVEMDHWRGEILYAGGGEELGSYTIRDTKIHDCNASAISMGGKVHVETSEIYDVYNGMENFSFNNHGTTVLNSIIEVNRNLPKGNMTQKMGKFGITFLGLKDAYLRVQGNRIGETVNGGVFLSEFAHNVTIKGNTFEDTLALYAIDLYMQPYHNFRPENEGFKNVLVENNHFTTKNRSLGEIGVTSYATFENLVVRNNTVGNSTGVFNAYSFFRLPNCVRGNFILENNSFATVPFAQTGNVNMFMLGDACRRPTWINNTFLGKKGEDYFFYNLPSGSTVDIVPIANEIMITDMPSALNYRIPSEFLSSYDPGYSIKITLARGGVVATFPQNPDWNTLSADVTLSENNPTLTFVKNQNGKFDLKAD